MFPFPVNVWVPAPSAYVTCTRVSICFEQVKITDAAGNLVYRTTSNGGTVVWNCQALNGQRVATGVYYIWTATNVGKDQKVGKVLIIN